MIYAFLKAGPRCGNGTKVLRVDCLGTRRDQRGWDVVHDGLGRSGPLVGARSAVSSRARQKLPTLASRRRAFAILLVQVAVPVIRARELSLDEEVTNLSLNFERIAVCHNNVGQLSGL